MKFAIIYLIVINVLASILFCVDKRRATKDKRRIPESILHLFELVGGIFTIIFLMFIIRHKNQKMSYKLVSFVILALWIFFSAVAVYNFY
ncbi:MAG: DUF1294 domain-containing protein [Bacteroidales bacterium]|nr:DUF1294 domain-containing protein [Bacteroidales bacterium]